MVKFAIEVHKFIRPKGLRDRWTVICIIPSWYKKFKITEGECFNHRVGNTLYTGEQS